MIETMLFLFLGIWLPCFVYFALFVYLFREGVAEGLDSSGNNFKQTVQWLTVVVFLLFSNYLVMMFSRYPEFGTPEFEELCKFSLSKVFLLSSFISSIVIIEYRWEYNYHIRLVLMLAFLLGFGTFLEISYLLDWEFPSKMFIGKFAVLLNFFSFLHILYSFKKEQLSNRSMLSGLSLLSAIFFYLNLYVEGDFFFDYMFAAIGMTTAHVCVIVGYLFRKKRIGMPKAYIVQDGTIPLEDTPAKYQSGTSEKGDVSLRAKLVNYLENEKPFLNKDLSMEQMADRLNTNKTYLSKIINVEMDRNFRDLINYYRVKEAIRIFNENDTLSIKELQEMVGFNNASSFTSAFKVNTGSTPGEWCKDIKSKRRTENGQTIKEQETQCRLQ